MALNANALTTLAVAKDVLDIPTANTSKDARVERLINAASSYIERVTDRKLVSQSHTEYQDGRRSNSILLRHYPVTGGPADGNTKPELRLDNDSLFTDASTLVDVADYYVADESEIVFVKGRMFPVGTRNIKIVYTAGYSTIPADLEEACLNIIQWWEGLQTNRDIGRPSKGKQGETTTIMQEVPPYIMLTLEAYKRHQFPQSSVGVTNG